MGTKRVGVGSPVPRAVALPSKPPSTSCLFLAADFHQGINLFSPESDSPLDGPLLIRCFRNHASPNSNPKPPCYHFRSLWRPERHKARPSYSPKGPFEARYRYGQPEGVSEHSQPGSASCQTNSQSDSTDRQVGRPLFHSSLWRVFTISILPS